MGVHTFSKSINPKEKVIARLLFELAYYDVVVLHVDHYDLGKCYTNYKVF